MLMGRWRLAVVAASGVLAVFVLGVTAPSAGAAGFKFERAFGFDGSSATEFSSAGSVAVDQVEGVVYVLDRTGNALYKFDLAGNPVAFGGSGSNIEGNKLSGLAIGGLRRERQLAVDSNSHTIYLSGKTEGSNPANEGGFATALQAFKANGEPSFFTAGPGAGKNEIIDFSNLIGVAVDAQGNIYAADDAELGTGKKDDLKVFDETGAVILSTLESKAPQNPGNIAVDAKGRIYALKNTDELITLIPSEFPVTSSTTYTQAAGEIDPNPIYGVTVEPVTNRLFVIEEYAPSAKRVAVFAEDGSSEGIFFGQPGNPGELKEPEGIAIGGDPKRVFIPDKPSGGQSRVKIFEEEVCEDCPPEVRAVSVLAVTGDSATLRAKINPNGRETTYWFEYGTEDCGSSTCAKVPLNGVSVGDGRKDVVVTQGITGLSPQTRYFYRVLAESVNGPAEPVESKTFTTQGSGLGFSLSDSRIWEMVSPSKKFGGTVVHTGVALTQASAIGDKLAYSSLGSVVEALDSSRSPEPATVLAKRNPSNGRWTSADLTAPHTSDSDFVGATSEYKIFTPDLLQAEMEPTDDTPLSPLASERTPYLWSDGSPPSFEPLVNPSNVPPGTVFGNEAEKINPVKIEGGSEDLSHIVLRSDRAPLVEDAERESIYMWSNGELEPLSELPEEGDVIKAMLGSGTGSVRHAVSDDGSRAFWAPTHLYNAVAISLPALYLRDTVADESVRLDVPEAGASGLGDERPAFNIASADGSVVFFTDTQQLTADASPDGRDLYRCEIGSAGGGLGCVDLTDISAPLPGSGESAEVMGQVPAASEDGSRLYFVAQGVLDEAPNEGDETATAGEPNLYYWQNGVGVRFIATLSENDNFVWGGRAPGEIGFAVDISAAASPGGRFFAFTSEKSLTGYDNGSDSDELNTEVFVYDAAAAAGKLSCVSCNPTGASAIGEELPGEPKFFPPDPTGLWGGRQVAAVLPQAHQTSNEGRALYRPRFVLDNGRVFFNAIDPLVPADSNGNWDVYQYEPVGVGGCTPTIGTAAIGVSGAGCVGLLSSGTSTGDSGFLDATPSGDDVFFMTRGRLSVLDQDEEMDVYDARVDGIAAVLTPKQECVGEACQSVVGAPNVPTAASESFKGPEPRVNCRKGQRKVHRNGKVKCVKKNKKKHGKHQPNKRGSKSRGAGR